MITQSSDADITDRSLEFDKRMGSVVRVRWAGLAASTEVGIVADSALVTISLDIGLDTIGRVAKWPVTIDAVVTSFVAVRA